LSYELTDTGSLNRDAECDRLHLAESFARITAKLHFYDRMTSRVLAEEMQPGTTVSMVRIECA